MYIAVDLERWAFVPYKTDNIQALCHLVTIEFPVHHKVYVTPLDHSAFSGLNDLQLSSLYQGLTGKVSKVYQQRLRNVLRGMADTLPLLVCDYKVQARIAQQATMVQEPRSESYQYNPDGALPIKHDGKWRPTLVKVAPLPNELEVAAVCPPVPPPPAPGTLPPHVAPVPRVAPAGGPAAATGGPVVRAPRQSGVRDTIHAVATELWKAAGSPKDTPTILKLRKEIMNVLEESHGVKRNTSSNELGNWQKQII